MERRLMIGIIINLISACPFSLITSSISRFILSSPSYVLFILYVRHVIVRLSIFLWVSGRNFLPNFSTRSGIILKFPINFVLHHDYFEPDSTKLQSIPYSDFVPLKKSITLQIYCLKLTLPLVDPGLLMYFTMTHDLSAGFIFSSSGSSTLFLWYIQ